MNLPIFGLGLLGLSAVCWVIAVVRRRRSKAAPTAPSVRTGELIEVFATMLPVVLVVGFVVLCVGRLHYISSQSMLPGLSDGSVVVTVRYELGVSLGAGRRALVLRAPRRGDVVVFEHPLRDGDIYVKRVIGLPGDLVVYSTTHGFAVNGKAVPSEYLGQFLFPDTGLLYPRYRETLETSYVVVRYDPEYRETALEPHAISRQQQDCVYTRTTLTCRLPEGRYFVAGDNRDRSEDSRAWGLVPAASLQGRVVGQLW